MSPIPQNNLARMFVEIYDAKKYKKYFDENKMVKCNPERLRGIFSHFSGPSFRNVEDSSAMPHLV